MGRSIPPTCQAPSVLPTLVRRQRQVRTADVRFFSLQPCHTQAIAASVRVPPCRPYNRRGAIATPVRAPRMRTNAVSSPRCLAAGLVAVTTVTAQASKPHIVFILVDDWGWSNVGYHRGGNHPEWQTPNIGARACWEYPLPARRAVDGARPLPDDGRRARCGRHRARPQLCVPVLQSIALGAAIGPEPHPRKVSNVGARLWRVGRSARCRESRHHLQEG